MRSSARLWGGWSLRVGGDGAAGEQPLGSACDGHSLTMVTQWGSWPPAVWPLGSPMAEPCPGGAPGPLIRLASNRAADTHQPAPEGHLLPGVWPLSSHACIFNPCFPAFQHIFLMIFCFAQTDRVETSVAEMVFAWEAWVARSRPDPSGC